MKKKEIERRRMRERKKIERHRERVREGEGRRKTVSKSSPLEKDDFTFLKSIYISMQLIIYMVYITICLPKNIPTL